MIVVVKERVNNKVGQLEPLNNITSRFTELALAFSDMFGTVL